MPTLILHTYQTKLLELNDEVYHAYVEADVEKGGGRDIVFLRQHDRGMPLTLRDNYSGSGTLKGESSKRDMDKLTEQFKEISKIINNGKIICVPIYPLLDELVIIEKYIPTMAQYIHKNLDKLKLGRT